MDSDRLVPLMGTTSYSFHSLEESSYSRQWLACKASVCHEELYVRECRGALPRGGGEQLLSYVVSPKGQVEGMEPILRPLGGTPCV
jgi:hypothetical protein